MVIITEIATGGFRGALFTLVDLRTIHSRLLLRRSAILNDPITPSSPPFSVILVPVFNFATVHHSISKPWGAFTGSITADVYRFCTVRGKLARRGRQHQKAACLASYSCTTYTANSAGCVPYVQYLHTM